MEPESNPSHSGERHVHYNFATRMNFKILTQSMVLKYSLSKYCFSYIDESNSGYMPGGFPKNPDQKFTLLISSSLTTFWQALSFFSASYKAFSNLNKNQTQVYFWHDHLYLSSRTIDWRDLRRHEKRGGELCQLCASNIPHGFKCPSGEMLGWHQGVVVCWRGNLSRIYLNKVPL